MSLTHKSLFFNFSVWKLPKLESKLYRFDASKDNFLFCRLLISNAKKLMRVLSILLSFHCHFLYVSVYGVCRRLYTDVLSTNPVIEGQTKLNTDALFSNNNTTECEYSFHGFSFLISKHVVLTDEKHFKGQNGCSVEFFDLPSGIIYVKLGPKLDGTSPLGLMQSGQR